MAKYFKPMAQEDKTINSFPSPFVDPEKKKEDKYGLDYARAIWQAYTKNQTTGKFEHQLFHTQALTDGLTTFRLPGGFESDRYRVKITGTGKFRELRVAQTARELGTV